MPSLNDVLAGIPGYAGVQASRARNQAQEMGDLQQAGSLIGLQNAMQAQEDERQLKSVMAQAGGDPARAVEALLKAGTPKSIALASHMKGMLPKPAEPFTLGPEQNRFDANGNLIAVGGGKEVKPIIQPNFPISDTMVQPHISRDEGITWAPLPGSKPSAKFAKTIEPTETKPTLNTSAIEAGAERYLMDGTLPPNMGRGAQGSSNASAIQNRAAELIIEKGLKPEEVRQGQLGNKARQLALGQLEKNRNAVQSFEGMLQKNIDVLTGLSKEVTRSNSAYANRPILWLQQNVTGEPAVADYLFQVRTVSTEIARILNNPNLTGQLTDTARRELDGVVSGNLSPAQLDRVLARAKSDAANRSKSLDEQATKLNKEMRFWEKPAAKKNYVETRRTKDNRLLGRLPDGTIEEIKE